MQTKQELNEALYQAAADHRFEEIEELLNRGADPLGTYGTDKDNILGVLFCEATDDPVLAEALPRMVEQFYAHGMDIAARRILSNGDNNIHPLWDLAFCSDEYGMIILKTMLDHGLDVGSAEILVDHIFMDMEMCDGCEIKKARFRKHTTYVLKMVMLTASYPQILTGSDFLGEWIELEHNHPEDLPGFRNWNDYEYRIDLSTCTNIPYGLLDATLTILDKKTGKPVWTMQL